MSSERSALETFAGRVATGAQKTITRLWSAKFAIFALFVLGLLLVSLRTAIVWMSPWVEKHLTLVVDAWNVIGDIMEFMFLAIKLAIGAIVEAIHLLEGKKKSVPWPIAGMKFKAVDSRDAVEVAYFLPTLCRHYGTAKEIVYGLFDSQVGVRACMLLRALYPTPARNVSDALLGWAVGDRDTAPLGMGNGPGTCEPAVADMSMVCVAFGSGALLLEIIIPLIIGCIVLVSWLPVVVAGIKVVAAPFSRITERALQPPPYTP